MTNEEAVTNAAVQITDAFDHWTVEDATEAANDVLDSDQEFDLDDPEAWEDFMEAVYERLDS